MLSKNKIKLFNSLKLRKYREKHRLFLAEGEKTVSDLLLSHINAKYLIIEESRQFKVPDNEIEIIRAHSSALKSVSLFKNPSDIIGVFEIPEIRFSISDITNKISLFCDNIQDPGNFGTIVRTADWFGIEHIICSVDTADIYNPKVVQATMGAIAGVKVLYVDPEDFFQSLAEKIDIYGSFLDGENIYKADLSKSALVVIGNEGNGISERVESFIEKKLSIPQESKATNFSESLNVSVAAGIICSEFVRPK